MYSSPLSRELDNTHRFDLTGQAEINFLLARAGKTARDQEFMQSLKSLLEAQKVGRRRWQNRLSAARHYSKNKETKRSSSRAYATRKRQEFREKPAEEQEVVKQRNRELQGEWRMKNAERLACKQRERRVQRAQKLAI
ncbi:hypothetical protein VNI00_005801 [Paramarasmius palmivorus]|uniref:Uncharacterized protein n=1 Tax=Paramarasmius palmivorus TaxID=297713 RepID=A0AAW0DA79_9AGAR